jgi:hypothetical protein
MPAHGIIKEYMERVIELTFERMGWDRATNTPGLPIVPSDFMETLPLIKDEIQYSTRGNEDVWGALYSRFNRLCNGVLNSVFGTVSGISMSELTARPSLILLDRLSKDEQSFFVFWFVSRIARFFEAKKKTEKEFKKGLKFLVVLEEAHRILRNEAGVKVDEEHGAKQAAVESITTTMKESRSAGLGLRSAGLGFTIIAPGLTELTSSAYTMALNIIMHGKGAKQDRKLIGDQMNCTDDQIRMIGSLPVGEAVVRTASISRPVRVRVNDPVAMYPELASGKPVTDDEIIAHMKPVFEKNPHFKTKSELALKSLTLKDLTDDIMTITIDMNSALKLYAIFQLASFGGVLKGIQGAAENGSHLLIAFILRNIARLVSKDTKSLSLYCHHLVWSISRKDGIVSEDDLGMIVNELKLLVDIKELKDEIMHRFHQRISEETNRRSGSFEFNRNSLTSELKEAVAQAIQERTDLREVNPSTEVSDDNLSNLHETLMALVRTDQFSTRYPERIDAALKGNFEPLVKMIITFARSLDIQNIELRKVAALLLNHARSVLESPDNNTLWKSVHELMISDIDNLGSEVAA